MRSRHVLVIALAFLFVVGGLGLWGHGLTAGAALLGAGQRADAPLVPLPNEDRSFKFGVLGDFGTGAQAQYQLGQQMARLHERFRFDTVVTVGDNLIGSERPQDFRVKFELPYKALLEAGVKFYATLGNHDAREQRYYKLFNMGGSLYYTLNPSPDVRFFMLEATYPTPEQFAWLETELKASNSKWKIAVFHQPLYSSGSTHGADVSLREMLEPFFVTYGVSVVLSGHEHFYERVKPQQGIAYFVVGAGGKLRVGDLDRASRITAKGFDTDQSFMAAEIIGDEMYFNTISRLGLIVDSGVVARRTITR